MALPDDFDLDAFLTKVDQHPDLRGIRVVYFDGYQMITLREGPPYCDVGQMAIVIRDGIEDPVLHSASAAQSRDGKLLFELLGAGLSCSAAVLGWVVVFGSAGAAPITGGASTFLTYLSIGAAGASTIQMRERSWPRRCGGTRPREARHPRQGRLVSEDVDGSGGSVSATV